MRFVSGLEKIIYQNKFLVMLGAISFPILAQSQPIIKSFYLVSPSEGSITNEGYFIINTNNERRVYKDGHHFLSIIDRGDIFAFRPHPGKDINGWGGTVYIQPHISGSTFGHMKGITCNVVTNEGISKVNVNASGEISEGINSSFGNWNANLNFIYDKDKKEVFGEGKCLISLPSINIPNDLYFFQFANNILLDVPKIDGSVGDSGDTKHIEYLISSENQTNIWYPECGNHFPTNNSKFLHIKTPGNYNDVDTLAQGIDYTAPAYKPEISISLSSEDSSFNVFFGTRYDSSVSKDSNADNLNITPWINKENVLKNYDLNLSIHSKALLEDRYSNEFYIHVIGNKTKKHGIYSTENLEEEFKRVGSMENNCDETFTGMIKVNQSQLYFKIIEED